MQAKKGDTVLIHYKAKIKDLVVFDTTSQQQPLKLTIGKELIIPSFEEALVGMSPGEEKTIFVPASKAFGPHLKELVTTVERSKLPPNLNLEIGQQLQVKQPDGAIILVIITNLTENEVTLDANHPLAGQNITFDIHLLSIE